MIGSNKTFHHVRALVFDLDGTLIDSKLDLVLAVNAMMKEMGRAELDHETIASYVGNGAPVLIQRALGHQAPEGDCAKALDYFLRYYREHMMDNTVAYPGVKEGLAALQKFPMAILTNKPVRISRIIAEALGIAKFFRCIYGGNSFERKKPDPLGLQTVLRELDSVPGDAIMVGDSAVDIQTARNAATLACGVSYGFSTEGFVEFPPDVVVDSLEELPELLALDQNCETK
jgi:phosphoglycolate phosphatase